MQFFPLFLPLPTACASSSSFFPSFFLFLRFFSTRRPTATLGDRRRLEEGEEERPVLEERRGKPV